MLGALACGNAARREGGALAQAVERYQRAPADQSGPAAAAVDAVACTDARVCDAKQACAAAIDATSHALVLKEEVTVRLADLESGKLKVDAPEAEALPGKLDEASRLLREGHEKMPDCERKLTTLRIDLHF